MVIFMSSESKLFEKVVLELEEVSKIKGDPYSKSNISFKPMNELIRNKKRLDMDYDNRVSNLLLEIIKNSIEHGLDLHIKSNEDSIVFFNNVTEDVLSSITFADLIVKLTTFSKESESNFNEGLTLLMYLKVEIRVANLMIRNKHSGKRQKRDINDIIETDIKGNPILEDLYYQYIDTASHYFEKGDLKVLRELPYLKGWKITLFTGKNTNEYLYTLKKLLDQFIFLDNFLIRVNGKKYKHKNNRYVRYLEQDKIEYIPYYEIDYSGIMSKIRFKIDIISEDEMDEVKLIWRLANGRAFHFIENYSYYGKNFKGFILFDNIKHFANENRKELNPQVKTLISQGLEAYARLHLAEIKLQEKLKNYLRYKESLVNYISELLFVSKSIVSTVFFDISKPKKRRLLDSSYFIHTIKAIFKKTREYRRHLDKSVLLFNLPDESMKILKPVKFRNYLNLLKVDLYEIFPKYSVGLSIEEGVINGEILYSKLIENYMNSKNEIPFVNSEETPIERVMRLEVPCEVIYPFEVPWQYLYYLFEEGWYFIYDFKGLKKLKKEKQNFSSSSDINVDDLKDFGVTLDSKKEKDLDTVLEVLEKEYQTKEEAILKEIEKRKKELREKSKEEKEKEDISKLSEKEKEERRKLIQKYWKDVENEIRRTKRKIKSIYITSESNKFHLTIIKYGRNKQSSHIPFLFNTIEEANRYLDGYHVTTRITPKKYSAFRRAVRLMVKKIGIEKVIYPVFFCDEKSRTIAFYGNSMVAFNTAKWLKGENDIEEKMKVSVATDLLDHISHELAHIKYKGHNKKHQQLTTHYTRLSKGKYEGKYIINLVKNEL